MDASQGQAKNSVTTSREKRFDEIYRLHYRAVFAYCGRRSQPSRVDDAVAEVFMVAWRRIEDVPMGEAARRWLYGVAYRVMANQWRGERRESRLRRKVGYTPVEATAGPALQVVQKVEYELINRALGTLEPRAKELLRLSIWEELSQADIASIAGLSEGAVKQRLHRARKKLAKAYDRLISDPVDTRGGM